jgi:hypothetical protein
MELMAQMAKQFRTPPQPQDLQGRKVQQVLLDLKVILVQLDHKVLQVYQAQ